MSEISVELLGELEEIIGGVLKKGSKGDDVATAQRALVSAGFMADPGPDIGTFGPKTKAAVEAFQKARGLKVDGVIGPETRVMMDKAAFAAPFAAPKKGASTYGRSATK